MSQAILKSDPTFEKLHRPGLKTELSGGLKYFYVHRYLRKWSNLTCIFFRWVGENHQTRKKKQFSIDTQNTTPYSKPFNDTFYRPSFLVSTFEKIALTRFRKRKVCVFKPVFFFTVQISLQKTVGKIWDFFRFFLWPDGVSLLLFRDFLLTIPEDIQANTETEVGCFRYDLLGDVLYYTPVD